MRAGSSLGGGVTAMAACRAHDAMSLIQQQPITGRKKEEKKAGL